MSDDSQNEQSDYSMKHHQLNDDIIQFPQNKSHQQNNFFTQSLQYKKNPFENHQKDQQNNQNNRNSLEIKKPQNTQNQFENNPFQKKQSFPPKFSLAQSSQSFVFRRKSKNQMQKKSQQFQFNNNQSGSLFSSQKSQKEIFSTAKTNKNLQSYTKLLKQYYNQSYLNNRTSKIRRNTYNSNYGSIRRSQIPYFITRQPIIFQKKLQGVRSSHGLSGNFLCKIVQNRIYYKDVSNEQLLSNSIDTDIKCEYIQLANPRQSISPSLQIDSHNLHLYYFSNTKNQIVVLSLAKSHKHDNEICRIEAKVKRCNPLLYLIAVNTKVLLLLVGGYISISQKNSQQVQGCKFIQIFSVGTWGKDIMTSKVIKMICGKIYPLIVFPVKIQQNDSILIIGGNTMAKKIKKDQINLNFKQHKVINKSSNYRGVFINTKQIIQCLEQNKDVMQLPASNSISVQIQQRLNNLHSGFVDYIKSNNQKQKIRLFLPKMRQFYKMKIIKKEVRIIKQSQQKLLSFQPRQKYEHLQIKCFKKPTIQYYQINNKGYFTKKNIHLSGTINGNQNLINLRCPCQFM